MDRKQTVVAYIKSLDGFRLVSSEPYAHMGGLLTDAVLQAGINYRRVVEPRVNRLMREHPSAQRTSGFVALLRDRGPEAVLSWKAGRKPQTLLTLAQLLLDEQVETTEDLQRWLRQPVNSRKLQRIKGIGLKTVDYLRILAGIPAMAIDLHLQRFLADAGTPTTTYDEARKLLESVADVLGADRGLLDYSIWKYVSEKRDR